jgi:hypothetical protein
MEALEVTAWLWQPEGPEELVVREGVREVPALLHMLPVPRLELWQSWLTTNLQAY